MRTMKCWKSQKLREQAADMSNWGGPFVALRGIAATYTSSLPFTIAAVAAELDNSDAIISLCQNNSIKETNKANFCVHRELLNFIPCLIHLIV